MALFGKKKKNTPVDDDLDEFAIANEDDEIFASHTPAPNYDDDIDEDLDDIIQEEGSSRQSSDSGGGMSRSTKMGLVVLGIIIALFAASQLGVFDTSDGQQDQSDDQAVSQEDDQAVRETGDGVVVDESVGKSYVGSDKGNPINGTGAIMAFTYHYYTTRSGEESIKHFNPEATSYDAEYIQNHIDDVPEGTKYELTITPRTIGSFYDGILNLSTPDGSDHEFFISYEVMEKDGRFFVKTFSENAQAQEDN